MDRLVNGGAPSVSFLERQVPPEPRLNPARLPALTETLGSSGFAERDRATHELEALGYLVKPALEKALREQPALETARRLRQLLARLDVNRNSDLLCLGRAIKVLTCIDTPRAHRLLRAWAARTPFGFVAQESKDALAWLEGNRR